MTLRSPYASSIRLTGTQYFHWRNPATGYAAFSRENAWNHSSAVTSSAGYGALRSTDFSAATTPVATSSISALIAAQS